MPKLNSDFRYQLNFYKNNNLSDSCNNVTYYYPENARFSDDKDEYGYYLRPNLETFIQTTSVPFGIMYARGNESFSRSDGYTNDFLIIERVMIPTIELDSECSNFYLNYNNEYLLQYFHPTFSTSTSDPYQSANTLYYRIDINSSYASTYYPHSTMLYVAGGDLSFNYDAKDKRLWNCLIYFRVLFRNSYLKIVFYDELGNKIIESSDMGSMRDRFSDSYQTFNLISFNPIRFPVYYQFHKIYYMHYRVIKNEDLDLSKPF